MLNAKRCTLILCCTLFFCIGCNPGRHIATVEIFNAQGESTGKAVFDLPRPMMAEYKDAKADSSGVSWFGEFWKMTMQIVTLGLLAD